MSDHKGPIITIVAGMNAASQPELIINIRHPQGGVIGYVGKALHMELEASDPKLSPVPEG